MSQTQTEIAIRRYKDAYIKYHGRVPDIRGSNGWIKINHIYNAQRPFEVIEMADRLNLRARREGIDRSNDVVARNHDYIMFMDEAIEVERARRRAQIQNEVWDVREEQKERLKNTIKEMWTTNEYSIKPSAWRSSISGDIIIMFFNRLFEECGNSVFEMERKIKNYALSGDGFRNNDDDIDEMAEHIEYLEEKISDIQDSRASKEREIIKLRQAMNELKKNSVVFSMDGI